MSVLSNPTDTIEPPGAASPDHKEQRFKRPKRSTLIFTVLITIAGLYLSLYSWRKDERGEIVSLTNLQRLANAALLYAQDWDSKPPPTKTSRSGGSEWVDYLKPYLEPRHLQNPGNPTPEGATDLSGAGKLTSGFAYNIRFQNQFGTGTYPLESLELPANTAFFVGAGVTWRDPLTPSKGIGMRGTIIYTDISERDPQTGFFLFPSSMHAKIPVAAADGHAELVEVENYTPSASAPHDKTFGRIGGGMYNWNGGYPNGETDTPPRE